MKHVVWALFIALSFMSATAQAAENTVGVKLYAGIGTHFDGQRFSHLNGLPVPILEFKHRNRRIEFTFQTFPGTETVRFAHPSPGTPESTGLSYLEGMVRLYSTNGRYFVGAGASVLNQRTANGPIVLAGSSPPITLQEIDRSRVASGRYEIGWVSSASNPRYVTASLTATPSFHAIAYMQLLQSQGFDIERGVPEQGSQMEAMASWNARNGRTLLSYGLRYINYAARFTDTGELSDKNTLLMPFVGLSLAIK